MILKIKNTEIRFFNSFALSLKYDSVASAFSCSFYFDPNNVQAAELAHVGHYHKMSVEHNGEKLVTGYILSQKFTKSSVKQLASIGGYSLPGVLEDCEIPPDISLQTDGLSLRQIASRLIKPFGLNMVVDPAVSAAIDSSFQVSTAKETETIKKYLTDLATQKNINITHDELGNLLFTKVKANKKPIAHFEDGLPGTEIELEFNGQAMHSHLTVRKQHDTDGGNAGEHTVRNPFVPFVYRPAVKSQNSGDDIDTEQAAKNLLAAELKNITLTITTSRWEIDGKIIKPNNVISVLSPENYIYKKTNFFIESVDLKGDNKEAVATLKCVLPEVYNGQTPVNIFED